MRREDRSSISSYPLADLGGGGAIGLHYCAIALPNLVASKCRPCARTLQAIRASLLASAIASTLRCSRFLAASIQDLSPWRSQLFGLISTTHAACPNKNRKWRLPRFDILPRMVRSPVEICLGTRPRKAAKSRPLENTSPAPIAATIALEMI